MNSDYEEKISLYTASCDLSGAWKLSSLLDEVQKIAHKHNELVGCSGKMIKNLGLTWILFQTKFEMFSYPHIGDEIRVTTFVKKPVMNFLPRYYVLQDEQDNQIGAIGSLWAMLDIKSRKTVAPVAYPVSLPTFSERIAPISMMTPFPKVVSGNLLKSLYTPQFCDIDINRHVNNTVYFDWLYNTLGFRILKEKEIVSAMANYNYEICIESIVENSLLINENSFCFSGLCNNRTAFEIVGELRKKA